MTNATLDKQLMITVDNRVGALAELTGIISEAGINVVAACAYVIDNKGFILFVTKNNKRAKRILEQRNYNVREEEIVLLNLENKPGALQVVSQKIADIGIDLTLLYGSVAPKGKTSQIVLVSEDNRAVLLAIRKK